MRWRTSRWSIWLAIGLSVASAGVVSAQAIREKNYLHTEPERSIWLHRWFNPTDSFIQEAGRQGVDVMGFMRVWSNGSEMVIEPNLIDAAAIVFKFDQEICGIGMQMIIDGDGKSNSVPVTFSFFNDSGQELQVEERKPAKGTTRQSFGSITYGVGFHAVQVSSSSEHFTRIGEIWATPCIVAIS